MRRVNPYESAFEALLRAERVPYVAVDEAKRALLPERADLSCVRSGEDAFRRLKSFDFVVYGPKRSGGRHLLVEVKGRKIPASPPRRDGRPRRPTLQTWVTRDDLAALETWQQLFGEPFDALIAFVYRCDAMPPDGLFERVFEHRGVWFAVRGALARDYAANMRTRSPKWGTVDLPSEVFDRISRPVPAGWDGWLDPGRGTLHEPEPFAAPAATVGVAGP